MDANDLLVRWKEVVKVCGTELNAATKSKKEDWRAAKTTAEDVVKALQPLVTLEKVACNAWAKARTEKTSRPAPSLKLVKG